MIFHTFFIGIIPFFNLYPCINNRYKMDMLLLHFLYKFRKLRKCSLIQGEIFITFHIINIQIYTVQRNPCLSVLSHHFPDFILIHITPAALPITKSPLRSNIAASDHTTKLLYNLRRIFTVNHIHIQIPCLRQDTKFLTFCIPHIKRNPARIIEKHTKADRTIHNQKIMCPVQRLPVLPVIWLIRTVTGINPATFIYSAYLLSQSVNIGLFLQLTGKRFPLPYG